MENNKVFVSIEYNNDWELDLRFELIGELEKISSIRSVRDIISYTLDKK